MRDLMRKMIKKEDKADRHQS
jgi:hypothetical protein